ncbi:MAG: cysteine desulfurase [Acidobacteria bacterium]|nr:MAG: cysteine desulfurase [Acidobacteriota bacterium]
MSSSVGKQARRPIYLDYNATTPLAPEVAAAMRPFLEEHFGNPSSAHRFGTVARTAVEKARSQVAGLLNVEPEEIIFTSGGTESNNYAIRGAALASSERGRHVITSRIEHPAVTEVCRQLETEGFEITWLPVDGSGLVRVVDVAEAIRSDTILITLMHANNEVGTIQPIREVAEIAGPRGILLHTDAAQSVGKIPTDIRELRVDLLTVAGHKLYGPKGVGALYVSDGVLLHPLMRGAGQERGRRPGTENVLEIVGLGEACQVARHRLSEDMAQMRACRDELERGLCQSIPDVRVNGHRDQRLPNTLSISIRDINADQLLAAIEPLVAASAGAACHSGQVRVSHVLEAMAIPEDWARGTIRLSTGRNTTVEEVRAAAAAIAKAADQLRRGQL